MKRSIDIQTVSSRQSHDLYEEFKKSNKERSQAVHLLLAGVISLYLTAGFLCALLIQH
ncbi:hypothetical protein [Ralstonia pickettii]|uniref:hypothetical protein n=1 Tax=Ralstonia pickettii TaxID=329 RepID=UPI002D790E42|nr:hypothetical protein [Ralstonia pickettii]